MFALTTALSMMLGCSVAPVYQDISAVTIHTQTSAGTARRELSGKKLEAAARCLYSTTVTERTDESEEDLLGSIFILEVKDRLGDRMFELYATEYMKGNKGKFYRNDCIYEILQQR